MSAGSGCCCGWTVAAHLELACTRPGRRLTWDMAVAGRRELDGVGRLGVGSLVLGEMVVFRGLVGLMGFGSLRMMVLGLEVQRRSLLDKGAAEVVLDRRMILVRICSRRRWKILLNEIPGMVAGSSEGCIEPFWLRGLLDKLDQDSKGCRGEIEL